MKKIIAFLHWLNTKLRPIGLFGRKKQKAYNIYPLVVSYDSNTPYFINTSSSLFPSYTSNGIWLPTSTPSASYI